MERWQPSQQLSILVERGLVGYGWLRDARVCAYLTCTLAPNGGACRGFNAEVSICTFSSLICGRCTLHQHRRASRTLGFGDEAGCTPVGPQLQEGDLVTGAVGNY